MTLLSKPLPKKLGKYAIGKADEHLVDASLLQAVRQRRRQLSQMTTAFDLPLAKQRLPDADYRVSRKIDGEYTCLLFDGKEAITMNPGGVIRAGAPFHEEATRRLKDAGIKSAMLGGELHVNAGDGGRTRIHDVVSKARSPKSQADVDDLRFAVFNIYELDGNDLSMRYGDAIDKAAELFADGERVFAVETHTGDRKTVFKYFDQWVTEGVDEGVVVRSDSAGVFKIKPRHSLDVAILGFSEGLDDRSGMLHSLLVGIARDDEHAQVLCRVGGGFTDEERVSLFQTLQAQTVESDYAEVNSDRVAYRMIAPGPVVEISCLELIARTLHGSPVDRMVIEWNAKEKRWRGVRRLPLCSVRSPQFERLRDDKHYGEANAGMQRLRDIVDIPESTRGGLDALELPKSEILARRVGQKVIKETTMVRKLLVWATHKQEASRDYPAYVLHLTDYSPNRRDALTHDICVSDSETQIRELLDEWTAKAFVRGWKRLPEFEVGDSDSPGEPASDAKATSAVGATADKAETKAKAKAKATGKAKAKSMSSSETKFKKKAKSKAKAKLKAKTKSKVKMKAKSKSKSKSKSESESESGSKAKTKTKPKAKAKAKARPKPKAKSKAKSKAKAKAKAKVSKGLD